MEYEKVFAAVVVTAVGIFAVLSLMNAYNDAYGTSVGSSFNTTLESVQIINNVSQFTSDEAAATQDIEGSGTQDPQTNLVTRSLRIITLLPRLLGLVPDMLYSAAIIIGVPSAYVGLAVGMFVFAFTLLFAYLLLIGVKRLL